MDKIGWAIDILIDWGTTSSLRGLNQSTSYLAGPYSIVQVSHPG